MNRDHKKVADLREDYRLQTLEIQEVHAHPFHQFQQWFNDALRSNLKEPNVMTLATASASGIPSARIVLLKGYSEKGFLFYTNYNSRKGKELLENPNAALVFCWLELERQIRIEGKVSQLSPEASTQYFQSRPKGSQIGAWASPQSEVIEDRNLLEENVVILNEKYAEEDTLPRPEHWGGFLIEPTMVEFWQGRSSRLHDRIRYVQLEGGSWKVDRLAP
ncbi:MAG: pyridoxamine 5'-phosphate oxidase [Polaribacter sp.]|jgi:pyridoxamine 5'-phosphate oxidase